MNDGIVSISARGLSAEINPLGAQLFALRDAEGRDLLWDGDPAFWTGRAPLLFPIIGELAGGQYRLDGKFYRLPRHGFGRTSLFALVETTPSGVLFQLRANDQTLAVYPFAFELDMRFALQDATLTLTALVKNLEQDKPMPASLGFHPGLRWPLPYGQSRDSHRLLFEQEERAPIRRLDAKGLVKPQTFPTPVAERILLPRDSLFADDAIIFDRLASRRVRYGAAEGPQVELAFPDTPLLGVWSKPGAPFLCIEPWHGIADPEGFAGDFRTKPGIFLVPPGGAQQCELRISLLAAA